MCTCERAFPGIPTPAVGITECRFQDLKHGALIALTGAPGSKCSQKPAFTSRSFVSSRFSLRHRVAHGFRPRRLIQQIHFHLEAKPANTTLKNRQVQVLQSGSISQSHVPRGKAPAHWVGLTNPTAVLRFNLPCRYSISAFVVSRKLHFDCGSYLVSATCYRPSLLLLLNLWEALL